MGVALKGWQSHHVTPPVQKYNLEGFLGDDPAVASTARDTTPVN